MNADSFMHLLGAALVVGLGGYYGLRYLKARLDVGPARVYHPLNLAPYFRGAWEVFPRFKTIGWLLTIALFVAVATSFKLGDNPRYTNIPAGLSDNTSVSQYFVGFLSHLPRAVIWSQNAITTSFKISGGLPFVILLAYLVYKWVGNLDGDVREKAARISGYIIIGTVVQVVEPTLSMVLIAGGYIQPDRIDMLVQSVTGLLGIASYVFLLLGATAAEAIFLRIVLETVKGNRLSSSEAFGPSTRDFRPLFIFNLIFFLSPLVISSAIMTFWTLGMFFPIEPKLPPNYNDYINGLFWLLRMLFFLTPFFIVKDGLDLKNALKKNVSVISRAPLDYLSLLTAVIISILVVSFAFGAITTLLIQPYSHSFALMQIVGYLSDVYYIWFSLYAACVFALFSRQRFLNQPE